jgi:hypothetical protein
MGERGDDVPDDLLGWVGNASSKRSSKRCGGGVQACLCILADKNKRARSPTILTLSITREAESVGQGNAQHTYFVEHRRETFSLPLRLRPSTQKIRLSSRVSRSCDCFDLQLVLRDVRYAICSAEEIEDYI